MVSLDANNDNKNILYSQNQGYKILKKAELSTDINRLQPFGFHTKSRLFAHLFLLSHNFQIRLPFIFENFSK